MGCLEVGISTANDGIALQVSPIHSDITVSSHYETDISTSVARYGDISVEGSYASTLNFSASYTSNIAVTAGILCEVSAGKWEFLMCNDKGNVMTFENQYILVPR